MVLKWKIDFLVKLQVSPGGLGSHWREWAEQGWDPTLSPVRRAPFADRQGASPAAQSASDQSIIRPKCWLQFSSIQRWKMLWPFFQDAVSDFFCLWAKNSKKNKRIGACLSSQGVLRVPLGLDSLVGFALQMWVWVSTILEDTTEKKKNLKSTENQRYMEGAQEKG